MKNAYLTGYRSYELGIFSNTDAKVAGIAAFMRKREIELLDEGYDWFIFSGQLGVEYYAFLEALKLKEDYPLKIAVMFPFHDFGSGWSEKNQAVLQHYKADADFVGYVSKENYHSPSQLKRHTQFLLYATECAIVLYDDEVESKTKFFINDALNYQKEHEYKLTVYSLYDLQESLYEEMPEEQYYDEP